MGDRARARKLADRIQVIVAEMLERRVKDPRLGFVTVTDARITADLRDATVFYTVLGDDVAKADTAAALESATGVIRAEVGRATGLRFTPTLTFVPDAVPENAAHIEDLLRQAREADADVHAIASTATPAGDPDPYKRDAVESDADERDANEPDANEPDADEPDADEPDAAADVAARVED